MLINLSSIFAVIRKVFWIIWSAVFVLLIVLYFVTSFNVVFLILAIFIGIPLIVLKKFFHIMVAYPAKYDDEYLYLGKKKIKLENIITVKLVARNLYRIKVEGDTKKHISRVPLMRKRRSWYGELMLRKKIILCNSSIVIDRVSYGENNKSYLQ